MTEQDKILQDLRREYDSVLRDNKRLHSLVDLYIAGTKNNAALMKELRRKIAEQADQIKALEAALEILKDQAEQAHAQNKRLRLNIANIETGGAEDGPQ